MLTTLSHYFCRKALPQISNWVLNVALNCVCSNKVMYLILCKLSFSFSKFSWLQNNWLLHKLEWSWSNTFIAICICKELSSILENVITQPIEWNRLRIPWLVKSFKFGNESRNVWWKPCHTWISISPEQKMVKSNCKKC